MKISTATFVPKMFHAHDFGCRSPVLIACRIGCVRSSITICPAFCMFYIGSRREQNRAGMRSGIVAFPQNQKRTGIIVKPTVLKMGFDEILPCFGKELNSKSNTDHPHRSAVKSQAVL